MSTPQDGQIKTLSNIFALIQDLTMIHKSMDHTLKEMVQCDSVNNFDTLEEASNTSLDILQQLRKHVQNLDPC